GAAEELRRPDGALLRAVVSGAGHAAGAPTFVLTHGLACDHRLWAYQARLLGEVGRVVTWDLRGHGDSTLGDAAPARALRPDVHAADLAAVVERLATGPVFLVGHSLGGLATLLALRDNEALRARVAGAALVATPTAHVAGGTRGGSAPSAVEAAAVRMLLRWLVGDPVVQRLFLDPGTARARGYAALRVGGFGPRPSPAHVEALRAQIVATPAAVRRATLAGMERVDIRGTLGAVTTPTLVFVGGRDRLVDPRQAVRLAAELPNARPVVFSSAGHAVVLERHAAITRRIALLAAEILSGRGDLDMVASAAR
ncbi:MAG TPA: alpha/beta fold hydrolase, partial [Egibacteraceae bacterium]|nr:alpha/beta fold hydrolase [Egibacteraceae bacterium]